MEKTKAKRNWRDFLKEYAVIVVGVLTALAAQQAAEWWNWRNEVTEAKQIIAGEMSRNIVFGIERLRAARCIESRLQAVRNILDDASRTGTLPPLGRMGNVWTRPWSSGAWESIIASQTATHFPRQQLAALSLGYQRVVRVESWNRQEGDAWTILRGLSGPGRRFDPATEAEARKALGLATSYNYAIAITSERLIEGALELGLPFGADETAQMADALKNARAPRPENCQRISAVPATAVGLDEENLSRLDQLLKKLPWTGGAPRP